MWERTNGTPTEEIRPYRGCSTIRQVPDPRELEYNAGKRTGLAYLKIPGGEVASFSWTPDLRGSRQQRAARWMSWKGRDWSCGRRVCGLEGRWLMDSPRWVGPKRRHCCPEAGQWRPPAPTGVWEVGKLMSREQKMQYECGGLRRASWGRRSARKRTPPPCAAGETVDDWISKLRIPAKLERMYKARSLQHVQEENTYVDWDVDGQTMKTHNALFCTLNLPR